MPTPSKTGSISSFELDSHFTPTRIDPQRCDVHHDNVRLRAVDELYCKVPIYVGHQYVGDSEIVIGVIEVLSSSPCTAFQSCREIPRYLIELDMILSE